MGSAVVAGAVVEGASGLPVTVEAHVDDGRSGFTMVALPDVSCRRVESRVRAAVLAGGFAWPAGRVTVDVAPYGAGRQSTGLDLPIALAVLAASGQLDPGRLGSVGAVGELGPGGDLRPVPGMICAAGVIDRPEVVAPRSGGWEAALGAPGSARVADSLHQVVDALTGAGPPMPMPCVPEVAAQPGPDLADVQGPAAGRRALEVAAAGGHHLLMIGPRGAGAEVLACHLPHLLPDLALADAWAVTEIHSAAGLSLPGGLVRRPPFRAPHSGESMLALLGGDGPTLRPGEVSCAHAGVLFLSELTEFTASALDALRHVVDAGGVRVGRGDRSVCMPARVLLVAFAATCPCGLGPGDVCSCSELCRIRHTRRLTAPLVTQFALRVALAPDAPGGAIGRSEPSAVVAQRVSRVRALARLRGVASNADLPAGAVLDAVAPVSGAARAQIREAVAGGRISRAEADDVRRVARTLADLAGDDDIGRDAMTEALAYRGRWRTWRS